jgi:hypothetical protein
MCPSNAAPALISLSAPLMSAPFSLALPLLALAFLFGAPVWVATPILAMRRGSSARLAIMIVSLLATALLFVDLVIALTQAPLFIATGVCLTASISATGACYTGTQGALVALLGAGWAPLAGALLVSAPAWVMALTQTARWRQWGWFVAVLFLSPVATLLYALFGAERPARIAPASPARPQEPAPAI